MVTVLTDSARADIEARIDGDALWTSHPAAERVTGYELKPEGACRGEVCVPLPAAIFSDGSVDLAGLWRRVGGAVVRDSSGHAWALAPGAAERSYALSSLQAPDFTLPDLHGLEHTLSHLRGKKVFLATWASW